MTTASTPRVHHKPDEADRDRMMNTVAPFWDGNETWLILGGGGLFVAFPLAYSVLMPALYLPVVLMLLALVLRGVAFEFRWPAKPNQHHFWDLAFSIGSTLAGFAQGLILGGMLQGIRVVDGRFAGGGLDWLTPFALTCGLGVAAGYALLGATWLVMKTDGELAARARAWAERALLALLIAMVAVSLWTPLAIPRVAARWFTLPNLIVLSPIPLATAGMAYLLFRWLRTQRDIAPFLAAITLFLLGYAGLVISNYPYLVPPSMTVTAAAAAPESQYFMLIGTAVLLPVVLGYTVFVYYTFRGKVRVGEGYH